MTRLLLHKIKEGELDGLSLVYGGLTPEWKKLSDIPLLREAMHKIAQDEEALEQAKQNAALLEQQTFVADDANEVSALNLFDNPSTIVQTSTVAPRYFEGDDGTRYRWDEDEEDWIVADPDDTRFNDDDQSQSSANQQTNSKKRQRDDNNGNDGDDDDLQQLDDNASQADSTTDQTENAATELAKQKKKRKPRKKKNKGPNTWIYVDGLPPDVTYDEIKQHFSKVGLIAISPYDQQPRIKIYKESDSDDCKGDCVICYNAEESVQLAVDILNDGYIRPNYKIIVTRASFDSSNNNHANKEEGPKVKTSTSTLSHAQVKVARSAAKQALAWNEDDDSGISKSSALKIIVLQGMFTPKDFVDPQFEIELEDDIAGECQKFGVIEKLTIFSKNPRGVIVVKFSTAFSAQECIRVMNGRYFGGRQIQCHYWDGVTNYSIVSATAEEEEEIEELHRMDEFGDWLDQDQEELPEEFQLRTE